MKSSYLFLILALLLSSCSKKNEVDLYKEGVVAEEQKNFQLAIERYQEIVNQSPANVYADSALYRVAIIYNNDLHDYEKAAQAYRQYNAMFPNSKEAPSALFLCGFIFNNELHKLDSAKLVYEMFLQKYPDHSLAFSAKFELQSLGKDPGEFIKRDVVSSDGQQEQKTQKSGKQ